MLARHAWGPVAAVIDTHPYQCFQLGPECRVSPCFWHRIRPLLRHKLQVHHLSPLLHSLASPLVSSCGMRDVLYGVVTRDNEDPTVASQRTAVNLIPKKIWAST